MTKNFLPGTGGAGIWREGSLPPPSPPLESFFYFVSDSSSLFFSVLYFSFDFDTLTTGCGLLLAAGGSSPSILIPSTQLASNTWQAVAANSWNNHPTTQ